MNQPTYLRAFSDRDTAYTHMRNRNRASTPLDPNAPAKHRDLFCLVDGPEDNWCVVDIMTAIELGNGYEWT